MLLPSPGAPGVALPSVLPRTPGPREEVHGRASRGLAPQPRTPWGGQEPRASHTQASASLGLGLAWPAMRTRRDTGNELWEGVREALTHQQEEKLSWLKGKMDGVKAKVVTNLVTARDRPRVPEKQQPVVPLSKSQTPVTPADTCHAAAACSQNGACSSGTERPDRTRGAPPPWTGDQRGSSHPSGHHRDLVAVACPWSLQGDRGPGPAPVVRQRTPKSDQTDRRPAAHKDEALKTLRDGDRKAAHPVTNEVVDHDVAGRELAKQETVVRPPRGVELPAEGAALCPPEMGQGRRAEQELQSPMRLTLMQVLRVQVQNTWAKEGRCERPRTPTFCNFSGGS